MNLQGKTAIVTGGARRLGRTMSLALAERGMNLVIHYGRSAEAVEEVLAEVRARGVQAVAVACDFEQPAQAPRVMETALDRFGGCQVLVNNAAIFESGNVFDTDEANWDRHFAINLKAPFFLSQAFAKHVPPGEKGKIVNITDWRAVRPGTGHVAYTLTKAALGTLTQVLAQALAPRIAVNAVALGAILPPPGKDQAYLDRVAKSVPLRCSGSPEDVVAAVMFLLEGSDYVTGTTLLVDGGAHLGGIQEDGS
ncbi:MAG: SDR family oxidoreductase [Nitrospirae bacterium]|nr:MAG: SDR family oxidoreductase [Nitrospirota bacterium]